MTYKYLSKSTRLANYSVIPNELFALRLSSTAMILYAKLLNRANLSINRGYLDELGRVFIAYKQEDLARELGKSISTIKTNMNELVIAGLVEKRRANKGRANIIFVLVPEGSAVTDGKNIRDITATGRKSTVYGTDNHLNIGGISNPSRVEYPSPSNNSSNKNNGTNLIYGEDTF